MKVNLVGPDIDRDARRTTLIVALIFSMFVASASAFAASISFRSVGIIQGWFPQFSSFQDLFPSGTRPTDTQNPTATTDPFKTPDQRINILLLGIGGEGHEGSQLTDTIMLASIDRQNERVALVSIPRDFGVPIDGKLDKINAVNVYAEKANPGRGAFETAKTLSEHFQIRIDRVVKIDFKGFEKFIDALGGIDVDVERDFIDTQFPTPDEGPNPYQYMTVQFKKGLQHMDGKTTLQYARSRHGNNGEGGDFARAKRQQRAIDAVRAKLSKLGTLGDPRKVSELWQTVSSHILTDISVWDGLKMLPLASSLSNTNITSVVLNNDPETGVLDFGPRGILIPRVEGGAEIRSILADPFAPRPTRVEQIKPAAATVRVEIRNGTFITGLAGQASDLLKKAGYQITSTANAANRNYEKSVIYDFTGGKNPEDLAKLKKLLDANVSTTIPKDGLIKDASKAPERVIATSTEFLIILGTSSQEKLK